jgi:hypothetical protein
MESCCGRGDTVSGANFNKWVFRTLWKVALFLVLGMAFPQIFKI